MEVAELVLGYVKVLIWPLTTLLLVALFRPQLAKLLSKITRAELPGGVVVDIGPQVKEVKDLSEKVAIDAGAATGGSTSSAAVIAAPPITEANAMIVKLGLRPSPSGLDMSYYSHWVRRDPGIALAGLRMELEIFADNLSKEFDIGADGTIVGHRLIQSLREQGVLTPDQSNLFQKLYRVCSAAAHGADVDPEEAYEIIDATQILADQYIGILRRRGQDQPRLG